VGGLNRVWMGLAGLALILSGCAGVPAGYGGYDDYGPMTYGGPVYGYGYHDTGRVGAVYDSSPGYSIVGGYPDHDGWNAHHDHRPRSHREPPKTARAAERDPGWAHTSRNRLSDESAPSWRDRREQARQAAAHPGPSRPEGPRRLERSPAADPNRIRGQHPPDRAEGLGRRAVLPQDDQSDKDGENRKAAAEIRDRQGRARTVRGETRPELLYPGLLWSP